jgi:hypothetical protein
METLFGFLGATILGAIGWWVGDRVGLMTAFILSTIATGIGLYAGRRIARDYLG